jgi:hypothetical protein
MPKLLERIPVLQRRRNRATAAAVAKVADRAAAQAPGVLEATLRAFSGPPSAKVQVAAPVLILATGAGVAVWWWTQWARGRAESEAEQTKGPE